MSSSTLGIWCGHHHHHHHHHHGSGSSSSIISENYIAKIPASFSSRWRKKLNQFRFSLDRLQLYSVNGDHYAYSLSDSRNSSTDHEGSGEENENRQGESLTSNEILTKLKRYGISGVLSYGLLNTAYYLCTFLVVWFYVAPVPGKMGYFAAVERFLKLMAMVWAGSQVTKLLRAGGALALAPFVDRGLSWFTTKFKFESQGKAFMAIVGFCFGLAIVVFLIVTLLWA